MFPFGAIFSGDPAGSYNKSRLQQQEIQKGDISSQADAVFGKSLQNLYQQMLPGAQPMPGADMQSGSPPGPQTAQNMQPPPGNMQPGGAPPPAGGPPPASPPSAPQPAGNRDEDSYGSSYLGPGGPPRPPAAIPNAPAQPQRPPAQGPQAGPAGGPGGPQGGPGGPGQGGILSLQQIIPAVQKAVGPNADPKVFAAAVSKYLPLMNASAQQQWREALTQMRTVNAQTAEERVQQGWARLKNSEDALAERSRHNAEAEAARKKSLDLREAKQHIDSIANDKRWSDAQRRMDEAEKRGNRADIMAQARIMHQIITENIATVNAGKLPNGMALQDKELQQQMMILLQGLQQSVNQHVDDITKGTKGDRGDQKDTFKDRFPGYN